MDGEAAAPGPAPTSCGGAKMLQVCKYSTPDVVDLAGLVGYAQRRCIDAVMHSQPDDGPGVKTSGSFQFFGSALRMQSVGKTYGRCMAGAKTGKDVRCSDAVLALGLATHLTPS